MKKLLALFAAATMMFTATANALIIDAPFGSDAVTGWRSYSISNSDTRVGVSVLDGKMMIKRPVGVPATTANSKNYGYFERTWDPMITEGMNVGTYTFNMEFAGVGGHSQDALLNGGGWNGYTITVWDADNNEIASFRAARNSGNIQLNGAKPSLAGATNSGVPEGITLTKAEKYPNYDFLSSGTTMGMEIVYPETEGEAGIVYLLRNGKKLWNADFTANVSAEVAAGVGAPAKISIQNTYGSIGDDVVLALDNISLHGTIIEESATTEDGYVFNDTFEAEEGKRLITDYGWTVPNYVYFTEDSMGYINSTVKTVPFVLPLTEAVSEGILVFEFDVDAFKADGTPDHFYSQGTFTNSSQAGPAFSATNVSGSYPGTVVSSLGEAATGGSSALLRTLTLNGVKTETTAPYTSAEPYQWMYVDCWKVVMDLDENVTDYYYRTTADGEWVLLNAEPVPFVTADTAINAFVLMGRHTHYQVEYSKIKAYTVDDKGFTTPVLFNNGALYTENAASAALDIYSAANVTVAEGEETPYPAIITALYDETGKFVECKVSDLGAVTGTGLYKAQYTLPSTATNAYTLKAFVWDGIDLMIPMSDVATVLPVIVEEDPAE